MIHHERIPRISASLEISFDLSAPISDILTTLKDCIACTKYKDQDVVEIHYRETSFINSWDVDSVLAELFCQCDLIEVQNIANRFHGRVCLCLVIYHYEKFPALVFSGKNMEIIHSLQADISIDPY